MSAAPRKHPPFPFTTERSEEIKRGTSPMTEQERERYKSWQEEVSQIKSMAGKKGGKMRWAKSRRSCD